MRGREGGRRTLDVSTMKLCNFKLINKASINHKLMDSCRLEPAPETGKVAEMQDARLKGRQLGRREEMRGWSHGPEVECLLCNMRAAVWVPALL